MLLVLIYVQEQNELQRSFLLPTDIMDMSLLSMFVMGGTVTIYKGDITH